MALTWQITRKMKDTFIKLQRRIWIEMYAVSPHLRRSQRQPLTRHCNSSNISFAANYSSVTCDRKISTNTENPVSHLRWILKVEVCVLFPELPRRLDFLYTVFSASQEPVFSIKKSPSCRMMDCYFGRHLNPRKYLAKYKVTLTICSFVRFRIYECVQMDLYLLAVRSMWKMPCEIRNRDTFVCLHEYMISESYLRSVEFLRCFF